MPTDLTSDQIEKLRQLGILAPDNSPVSIPVATPVPLPSPLLRQSVHVSPSRHALIPLLSIGGLTILSLGGLVLLKSQPGSEPSSPARPSISHSSAYQTTPTQVPKSIQHYLLASQQYFTQALQIQTLQATNSPGPTVTIDQSQVVGLLNQSILSASDAIKDFPGDYRGFLQRGHIYQSLIDSQPQLLSQAISDFTNALNLNPSSAEITHSLAALYARQGDVAHTLSYLAQTVNLEPTKAQNFYDLAKIQQQAGLLPQALDTYNHLLPLISDPTQLSQVETEKTAIEKLVAQAPKTSTNPYQTSTTLLPSITPNLQQQLQPAKLDQALAFTGPIIAAPDNAKPLGIINRTNSNSLSGTATLSAGQKSVVLDNSNLTPGSQVYVTALRGGKNLNLQLLSKTASSFTVGLDQSAAEDIEFKWWIVK